MDKNKMAVALFDKRAREYQDKFMDVALYHDSLNLFCDSISKKGADVLELACGPGNITRYLLAKRPDFRILATDLSENMLALAQKNNPAATFRLMDCRAIGNLTKMYEGLICGFGLPYLSREEALQLIAGAAERLRPGGVLYLSTMEGSYTRSGYQSSSSGDKLYIYYHERSYLLQAFQENGFSILCIQQKVNPAAGSEVADTDLILVARKK